MYVCILYHLYIHICYITICCSMSACVYIPVYSVRVHVYIFTHWCTKVRACIVYSSLEVFPNCVSDKNIEDHKYSWTPSTYIFLFTFTGWSFVGNMLSEFIWIKILFKQIHTNKTPIIGNIILLQTKLMPKKLQPIKLNIHMKYVRKWCSLASTGKAQGRSHGQDGTVRYGAVRYGAVRYGAVRCSAVQCGAVRCGTTCTSRLQTGASWDALCSLYVLRQMTFFFQLWPHRLNGYLAQRVPSLFLLASSFRNCLNCAVLKCMFACRIRYPLS